MTLSKFIDKTTAWQNHEGWAEWVVEIPLYDGTLGRLFVEYADTEFEAKEKAFTYLNNYFKSKT